MWLILRHKRSKIQSRNFERVFAKCIYRTEDLHMNQEKYKQYIIEMVQKIDNIKDLERIFQYVHNFFIKRTGE